MGKEILCASRAPYPDPTVGDGWGSIRQPALRTDGGVAVRVARYVGGSLDRAAK